MDGLVFLIGAVLLAGPICGIVALVRVGSVSKENKLLLTRLAAVQRRLDSFELKARVPEAPPTSTTAKPGSVESPVPPPPAEPPHDEAEEKAVVYEAASADTAALSAAVAPERGTSSPERSVRPPALPTSLPPREPPRSALSLEQTLGTKWISWVGIVMVLIGTALFLKYAYDQGWFGGIGPKGRLAIGCLAGLSALGAGEYYRRKEWVPLFQSVTGGGIAIFYICIYYSFEVYQLSNAAGALALAVLVTVLGIVMAVAHDALVIAVIAVLGGFLSPILLSSGGNHPYILFSYILILDLVALGAAYYRSWRALDLLCFLGTLILYQGWAMQSYNSEQMAPALIYTSLFYLLFLLVPTLYSLARKKPMEVSGLTMVIANAVYSLFAYYSILFSEHRYILGFVVIAQAILVLLLFQTWSKRVGSDNRTGESLLVISLALVTLAIPIQLRLYGIPIAWSVEGALLIHLGLRFKMPIVKAAGSLALLLAAAGLFYQLPLHSERFTVLFNTPFGSWVVVIASAITASVFLFRLLSQGEGEEQDRRLAAAAFVLGYALAGMLLTLETMAYWDVYRPEYHRVYKFASLSALWAILPAATCVIIARRGINTRAFALAWGGYAVGVCMFVVGLLFHDDPSTLPGLNITFAAKLLFVVSLWWGGHIARRQDCVQAGSILEAASHIVAAILFAAEFERWGGRSEEFSRNFALALLSAVWAFQAFGLIWAGLATRMKLRRLLGLALFGITVLKVVFFDMTELGRGTQIISFVASGLLLLVAATFYARFSAVFLEEGERGDDF